MNETENTVVETNEEPGGNGTTAADPNFIGQLSEEETNEINMCRQIGNSLTMELGQLDIQKARLLSRVNEIEGKLQSIVDALKARFELGEEVVWQVTPEGKLLKQDTPTGQAPPQ